MASGDSSVTSGEAGAAVADVLAAFIEHSPHIVRRGRTICFCEVSVLDGEGTTVAQGLVTYKLG